MALSAIIGIVVFNNNQNNIVGVQIVTSRGTVIIGRNKYSKQLNIWISRRLGWFDKQGKPNFFYVKHKKDKVAQQGWEIVWEWDELYLDGQSKPLIKFAPTQEEKDQSIETLSSLCTGKENNSLSCQWNVTNKINIEAITKKYICISDLASEFYGGAHPIALRRFGTYDVKTKKFVRFDELISNVELKNKIWQQLYQNISDILQNSFSNDPFGPENASGGVDSLTGPADEALNKALQPPQERLTTLLNSQGYSFSPNVFCPAVRPDGPFLLFGFPHAEQVNRGLNFRAEVLLNQDRLPKKVLELFNDYKFTKPEDDGSVTLLTPDKQWRLTQSFNEVKVVNKEKKVNLVIPEPVESTEDLLGVFWIYNSPSISSLERYKFRKLKTVRNVSKIEIANYLK
ncbi:MAG: hypothetical protein SFU25_01915 [Candidatus Caenarcaniphilales bacterium]|nr:hypothetical protein [Candidatus Caenarcaniphilales bacterium]